MKAPKSWEMASPEVKDFFEKVLNEAAKLLIRKLEVTVKAAVAEVENIRPRAFEAALTLAMKKSPEEPVQPDWLMVITARFLWKLACEFCEFSEEEAPDHGIVVPSATRTNSDVEPSPEHLMRLIEVLEKKVSDLKAKTAQAVSGNNQEW